MQRLNAAYQVLSDPERRRVYDAQRLVARWPASSARWPASSAPAARPPSPAQARVGSVERSAGPLQHMTMLEVADATPVAAGPVAESGAGRGGRAVDGAGPPWGGQLRQRGRP